MLTPQDQALAQFIQNKSFVEPHTLAQLIRITQQTKQSLQHTLTLWVQAGHRKEQDLAALIACFHARDKHQQHEQHLPNPSKAPPKLTCLPLCLIPFLLLATLHYQQNHTKNKPPSIPKQIIQALHQHRPFAARALLQQIPKTKRPHKLSLRIQQDLETLLQNHRRQILAQLQHQNLPRAKLLLQLALRLWPQRDFHELQSLLQALQTIKKAKSLPLHKALTLLDQSKHPQCKAFSTQLRAQHSQHFQRLLSESLQAARSGQRTKSLQLLSKLESISLPIEKTALLLHERQLLETLASQRLDKIANQLSRQGHTTRALEVLQQPQYERLPNKTSWQNTLQTIRIQKLKESIDQFIRYHDFDSATYTLQASHSQFPLPKQHHQQLLELIRNSQQASLPTNSHHQLTLAYQRHDLKTARKILDHPTIQASPKQLRLQRYVLAQLSKLHSNSTKAFQQQIGQTILLELQHKVIVEGTLLDIQKHPTRLQIAVGPAKLYLHLHQISWTSLLDHSRALHDSHTNQAHAAILAFALQKPNARQLLQRTKDFKLNAELASLLS